MDSGSPLKVMTGLEKVGLFQLILSIERHGTSSILFRFVVFFNFIVSGSYLESKLSEQGGCVKVPCDCCGFQ